MESDFALFNVPLDDQKHSLLATPSRHPRAPEQDAVIAYASRGGR